MCELIRVLSLWWLGTSGKTREEMMERKKPKVCGWGDTVELMLWDGVRLN